MAIDPGRDVRGGAFGSLIADRIATPHPDEVAGIHLTDSPFPKLFMVDRASLGAAESSFYDAMDAWMESAVYFMVQSAEPLTLAYGLTDSPVGLLAWIADKFDAFSDDVDPEDVVGITALTWLTGTAWSGFRLRSDRAGGDDSDWGRTKPQTVHRTTERPEAVARDLLQAARVFGEGEDRPARTQGARETRAPEPHLHRAIAQHPSVVGGRADFPDRASRAGERGR